MLIDSHCHLDFDELVYRLDEVIAGAKNIGVGKILCACSDVRRFDGIMKIVNARDNLFATIGQHPFDTSGDFSVPDTADFMHKKIAEFRAKILCVGECGLDYFYNPDDEEKKLQQDIFASQLDVARAENLPVMVHTRGSSDDTYNLLKPFADAGGRGVIHCFTGSPDDAKKYLDLGFYISASGIITFKKSDELRTVFADIPLDRLLVETDAPYLAPVPFRSKPNEPAFVKYVAEKLAEIKGVSVDEIAKVTTENFHRLYFAK